MLHLKQSLRAYILKIPFLLRIFLALSLSIHLFFVGIALFQALQPRVVQLDLTRITSLQSFSLMGQPSQNSISANKSENFASVRTIPSPLKASLIEKGVALCETQRDKPSKVAPQKKKNGPHSASENKKQSLPSKKETKKTQQKSSKKPAIPENSRVNKDSQKKHLQEKNKKDTTPKEKKVIERNNIQKVPPAHDLNTHNSIENARQTSSTIPVEALPSLEQSTDVLCFDIRTPQDEQLHQVAIEVQNALQAVWSGPSQRPAGSRYKVRVVIDQDGKAIEIQQLESSISIAYNISVCNALSSCVFPPLLRGVVCELSL